MAMVINSNLLSMNAQRQLMQSRADLDQTMERLSSGQRINSASDDAAGLSISSKMTSQVRGLNQAIRNANDGISMLQTAEGAMVESINILQRMRELSIQSANGIYRDSDRQSLNAEYAQLVREIDRIATTTTFNGLNILDGSTGDIRLHVGAQANETIDLDFAQLDSYSMGIYSTESVLVGETLNIDSSTGLLNQDYDRKIAFDTEFSQGPDGSLIRDVYYGDSVQTLVDAINNGIVGIEASTQLEVIASELGNGDLTDSQSIRINTFDLEGNERNFVISGTTNTVQAIAEKITEATDGYIEASVNLDGKLRLFSTEAATLEFSDDTGGVATGITDRGVTNEDAATVLEGLTSYWLAEAENLIESEFGLVGLNEELQINIFEDPTSNALAYVSYSIDGNTGEAVNFSLNVNLSYYQDLTLPNGDNGSTTFLDRVIAHEMTHAVFASNFDYTNILAPSWFTEGFPELIQGADERVLADLNAGNLVSTTFSDAGNGYTDGVSNWADVASNTGSPPDSLGYSLAYTAAKMLTDGLTGGSTLANFFATIKTESEAGNFATAIDTAIRAHTIWTTGSAGSGAALAQFNTFVGTNGWAYIQNALSGGGGTVSGLTVSMSLNDSDVGSIAGSDYGGAALTAAQVLPNDPNAGSAINYQLSYANEYSGQFTTADAQLVLRSTDGSEFSVLASYLGNENDLENLGFASNNTFTVKDQLRYISTAEQAQYAISQIDGALQIIGQQRADLGAAINRLDFSISNLSNVSENASAARSRIQDADYASETTSLWRNNILQNAGTAMLAQANSMPLQVLSLLRS